MNVTHENADVALSMMLDAAQIKNYHTAITVCNELMLLIPENPIVNFYSGFLATNSRDFFATTTFKILEKQLDIAVNLLENADYPTEEKVSLYKDFISKTILCICNYKSKGWGEWKLLYNMYTVQLRKFINKIRLKFLLNPAYEIGKEWVIEKGELLFGAEDDILKNYMKAIWMEPNVMNFDFLKLGGGGKFTDLPENFKEHAQFVYEYIDYEKCYGMWLRKTNQVTDEELKKECLKRFKFERGYYIKDAPEFFAKKEMLEKKMSTFFGRLNPVVRKEYKRWPAEEDYIDSLYRECSRAYIKFIEDTRGYKKQRFELEGRVKRNMYLFKIGAEKDKELAEEARRIAKNYLENGVLPEELSGIVISREK